MSDMSRLPPTFLRVALTGGIATGKTVALARFAALGVPTLDADELARDVVTPGSTACHAVRQRFGPAVLTSNGALDRKALAAVVFNDPIARRDLEAIIHPNVYAQITTWFAALQARGNHPVGIADIPLLYETNRAADFDRVIVTACAPETQVQRVMARAGATEAEARQRVAAQWTTAEKVARADLVIRTDGTLAETDRQVDELYRELWALAHRSPSEARRS